MDVVNSTDKLLMMSKGAAALYCGVADVPSGAIAFGFPEAAIAPSW